MAKEDNFLIYLMITLTSLNLFIPKEVLDFNHLDTRTHYVYTLWEQLPTMFRLVNTDLDFFQMKNLSAYVELILLN